MTATQEKRSNKIKLSTEDHVVDLICYGFMGLLALITLYPLLNTAAIAFSSYPSYTQHPLMIFPYEFDFSAFRRLFKSSLTWTSYKNTLLITVGGTIISVLLTILTAYPLAKKKVRGANVIMFFITFTMMFSGGIIPTYMQVKNLGLIDTLWSLMLPAAISTYNLVIVKNFMEGIPTSIEESASLDGAGYWTILIRIVIPLSTAVIATVSLFYAVACWNRVYDAIMYINSKSKWPLSLLMREIVVESADFTNSMDPGSLDVVYTKTIQCATIVVGVLPIMCVYPFVQKYFIKGVMLGAVKG